MSNTDLIIEERNRDIGDFMVGRLIPFRKKRMVGPFIFIDHMGPAQIGNGKYMDVDQHPHIGLSTLTYLLEGEMVHQDSIGSNQLIQPGSVNWMTAGKGVTHTERTPSFRRTDAISTVHGYQIWVALPKVLEEMEPSFHHIEADRLPQWTDGSANFKLVAGEGFGKVSPVPVHSPLFMVDIQTTDSYMLNINGQLKGEIGICIVKGKITTCEHEVEAGNMLVSKIDGQCAIKVEAGSHLLLFGGEPFEEERFIYWNFVASSKERLEEAKEKWRNKSFPRVPNDNTYVPLPGSR